MEKTNATVLIVGAGPCGLYAARLLAQQGIHTILLNRDLRPGGLVQYGLFHDKARMKDALNTQFADTLAMPNVQYIGGVSVGAHQELSLSEIDQLGVSAILFAHGAQETSPLHLPGAQTQGVFSAKEIIYHLSQRPPYSDREYPIGKHVIIFGKSDISAETALWLSLHPEVKNILILQANFRPWGNKGRTRSQLQFRHLAHLIHRNAWASELKRIEHSLLAVQEDPLEWQRTLNKFQDQTQEPIDPNLPRIAFRFLSSPTQLISQNGRITGVEIENNTLSKQGDTATLQPTAQREILHIDTFIHALSDPTSLPLPTPHQDTPHLLPDTQTPSYIAGWARNPELGINVGNARKDGEHAARLLLHTLQSSSPNPTPPQQHHDAILELLDQKGSRYLTKHDLIHLQKIEQNEAKLHNQRSLQLHAEQPIFHALEQLLEAPHQ